MDTKKLRQKILDLAIHGKLVPQDPNDEPASVLLERIRAEKERLIKEGKIKKSKAAKVADTQTYENVPFEVPEGWVWTTINDIAFVTKLAGFEYTKYIAENISTNEGVPLFKGKNILNGEIVYKFEAYIPRDISNELFRSQITKKCLLTPYVGTIGNIGIHDKDGIYHLGSNVGKIELFNNNNLNIHEEFVKNYLLSSFGYKELTKQKKATAQESISIEAIREVFIPLPPLVEQKRIITEIDRLFVMIDQIEQSNTDLRTTIKQAKSKILDLAIHGKLVPQDPNDEPASELLKRINPKAEIASDNGQYGKLPDGWCITKLGDISNYGENINIQVEEIDSNEWILELEDIEKDSAKIIQILEKHERCINGTRHKFTKGNILYSKLRTYLNKVLIAPQDGYCTTEIMAFNTLGELSNEYICHVLRSSYFLDYTLQCGYGVKMPRLSTTDACNGLIPLPPLAEQQRIVNAIDKAFAKLDKIMESL